MREIGIVLNNGKETFLGNEFSIYINNIELKCLKSFSLYATNPDPDEKEIRLDKIITYNVELSAPYFEEDTSEKSKKKGVEIENYNYFVKQLKEDKNFEETINSLSSSKLTRKTSKETALGHALQGLKAYLKAQGFLADKEEKMYLLSV